MWVKGLGVVLASAIALPAGASGPAPALAADRPATQPADGTPGLVCPVATAHHAPSRAARPGNVTVSVPRYTFVDERSGVTRVWTNTGSAPSPADTFVVLRPGRAGPAPASLITGVLARCR